MTYYYCNNCGWDDSCFPQLYVLLNSPIDNKSDDYHAKFDNKFENKFRELTEEIAKEKELEPQAVRRYHIGEVYNRYNNWLMDTQYQSFCSIKCAVEWLSNNDRVVKERVIFDKQEEAA